ncbi:acyltransferase family protein [Mycetohabitans rhizoxinica]|uniref:Acyltransferase n=1 Tax=Mycetohabitans rhizoxinica TaxID=412963 RepID=A0ABZ2Q4W3_9BURK
MFMLHQSNVYQNHKSANATWQNENFYRPDIDGLRAVAVFIVMLCHAKFGGFDGGYVGVDVFFVISGYVVASSIMRSAATGNFRFIEFYLRRARRLMPALFLMLATVLAFTLLLRVPSDAYDVAKAAGYITLMAVNIHFSKEWNYFSARPEDQPLLHTWSLSVEEQFYLIFPLVLIFLLRRGKWCSLLVLSALAIMSLCMSEVNAKNANVGAYYLFHNRVFELLIGVLIAFGGSKLTKGARSIYFDVLLLLGFACIGWRTFTFSGDTRFPGINALWPCLGAACIIVAGARARFTVGLLKNPLFVFIGKISYSLYLWHWPVLFVFWTLGKTEKNQMLLAISVTFLVSSVAYLLVERPLRVMLMSKKRAVITFMVGPLLFAGSVVAIGKNTDGFLFAYPKAVKDEYELAGTGVFDLPFADRCWNQVEVTAAKDCSVGNVDYGKKAVLWGDSHSYQMVDFFDRLGKDYGLSVHTLSYTMCPPIARVPEEAGDPKLAAVHRRCVLHDKAVMDYVLTDPEIKIVFMAAIWQLYANDDQSEQPKPQIHGFMPGEIDAELESTISKLRHAGKKVVLLDDVPSIPFELINCNFYNKLRFPMSNRDCKFSVDVAKQEHEAAKQILARLKERFPDISIIHTYDVPCDEKFCYMGIDGVPLYRYGDNGHLGLGGSRVYYDAYKKKHPNELGEILADGV